MRRIKRQRLFLAFGKTGMVAIIHKFSYHRAFHLPSGLQKHLKFLHSRGRGEAKYVARMVSNDVKLCQLIEIIKF